VVGQPLSGGARNDVRLVEINGELAVARLGVRPDDDRAWETELLVFLSDAGTTVPRPWPTLDGRLHADGLVVMDHVSGRVPESDADWRLVADYLGRVHGLTSGWPQRPRWSSSVDLVASESGTSVDLAAMPAEAVARCRKAWERLAGRPMTVVHGDPNAGNVRIEGDRVVLLDWDESRVDVPLLDLVLPANAAGLPDGDWTLACQASSAWEAAVCWATEPEYAATRLTEVDG
jgi:Ser/Thr protein kinase RdoA (MazF antagonist)